MWFIGLRQFIVSNPGILSRCGNRPGLAAGVPLALYFSIGFLIEQSRFNCFQGVFFSATTVGEEMRKAFAKHVPEDNAYLSVARQISMLPVVASAKADAEERKIRMQEAKALFRQHMLTTEKERSPYRVAGLAEGVSEANDSMSDPSDPLEDEDFIEEGARAEKGNEREAHDFNETLFGEFLSVSPYESLFGSVWGEEQGEDGSRRGSGANSSTALNSPHPLGYQPQSNIPSYYQRKARREMLLR